MISDRRANRRIRLILATLVIVFGAALGRAAWLQVVHAATYGKQAQRMHEETMTTPAGRGSILDRTGVQLAIGEQDTTIYADPHVVTDARGIALAAEHLLGANANKLYPLLLRKNSRFVYVHGSPIRRSRTSSSRSTSPASGRTRRRNAPTRKTRSRRR